MRYWRVVSGRIGSLAVKKKEGISLSRGQDLRDIISRKTITQNFYELNVKSKTQKLKTCTYLLQISTNVQHIPVSGRRCVSGGFSAVVAVILHGAYVRPLHRFNILLFTAIIVRPLLGRKRILTRRFFRLKVENNTARE